jgi:hypothetical protein
MSESSADLKTDVQIPNLMSQVYMDIQAVGDEGLDFRQIYGRVGNLLGGTYFSSFSDNGTLPQSIIGRATPAGAMNDPQVVQLQYVRLFESGVLVGAGIENPRSDDFTLVSPTDFPLQRVPDFTARLRYQPLDAWGSVQGAVLLRQFVYEDANLVEHFSPIAVSFSGHARFKTFRDNNVRLGVVGGEGAGGRIFGLSGTPIAAGPRGGRLQPLENVGAFASYQHFWSNGLWSNVAYGYAYADVPPVMSLATKRSQNGWINLIWNNPTGNIAVGVEYQFGQQEVGDGRHGFNHRVQLSFQVGKSYQSPMSIYRASAARADVAPPFDDAGAPGDFDVYPRL